MADQSTAVHVRYADAATWSVDLDDGAGPVSTHGSATEAQRTALELAERAGAAEVVVHDAYNRCLHFGLDALPLRRRRFPRRR